jgi:hypothetical protein
MDKIITGNDKAAEHGHKSYRAWLAGTAIKINRPWNGKVTDRKPVKARIDFGRWIADCECGGAEYVDPNEPIFYCLSCGNEQTHGDARKVLFPDNLKEIEAAVLERAVLGSDPLKARLVDGISRSWNPGESVSDLKMQHEVAKSVKARVK